MFKFKQDKLKY